jgi:hypothetical protein
MNQAYQGPGAPKVDDFGGFIKASVSNFLFWPHICISLARNDAIT